MAIAPSINVNVPQAVANKLVQHLMSMMQGGTPRDEMLQRLLAIDKEYHRENDKTYDNVMSKAANSTGDKSKMQNPIPPVVKTQVESQVAFLTSVFLTGAPIFGVTAGPEDIDSANQMNTLMLNHEQEGGWNRHLQMFFRDGSKYNLCALETGWSRKTSYNPVTDVQFSATEGRPKEVVWEGNYLKRLDLYNTVWDYRVAPAEVHEHGEFAGYVELMGRMRLKQFINDLPTKLQHNIGEALKSGRQSSKLDLWYFPNVVDTGLISTDPRGEINWLAWAYLETGEQIRNQDMYEVATIYARIIPQDFGLRVAAGNQIQIWKFVVVNSSVLIHAEPQTNAHGYLPILVGQPMEDGLAYQTKGLGQDAITFQDIVTSLWNANMHAKRRAVFDRMFYDPSRIREADINSKNPVARIPVKPGMYGKGISEAIHIAPFNDAQVTGLLQEAGMVMEYANQAAGLNRAQQGQFVKGNKTLHEYADVMGNANARPRSAAMFLEAQVFQPLKNILKLNLLQYSPAQELYDPAQQKSIQIDPTVLRKGKFAFMMADGLTPSDKLLNLDEFQLAMQLFMSSPQLQMEYKVTDFLVFYMKARGMRYLPDFKRTPDEIQQQLATINARTNAEATPVQQGTPAVPAPGSAVPPQA